MKVAAVQRTMTGLWLALPGDGDRFQQEVFHTDERLAHWLRRCGQSLVIPDDVKPGWVGIPVDLPSPPPMPTGDDATAVVVLYGGGPTVRWLPLRDIRPIDTVVCTVTLSEDADGEPVATVVLP